MDGARTREADEGWRGGDNKARRSGEVRIKRSKQREGKEQRAKRSEDKDNDHGALLHK